jgi:hypothetical protein
VNARLTKAGLIDPRPDREALTGDPQRSGGRLAGTRAGGGAAETASSYYGQPVLKPPVWKPRFIASYFFLGGVAGTSSVLGAAAALTRRPALARAAKLTALATVSGSAVTLVADLGKPTRLLNMLRVLKPSSPMSVGSWLLAAYGPAAGVAAASDLTGWFPAAGALATGTAALLGPAVATYTSVLAADTAVPAWHDGFRELPIVFAASAAAGGAGAALAFAPVGQTGPARRIAAAGVATELLATKAMERRLGAVAEPYHTGRSGRLLHLATTLGIGGAAMALAGRRSRMASFVGGAALVAASALTKFGVFEAGMASARDPRATVDPQRARAARR